MSEVKKPLSPVRKQQIALYGTIFIMVLLASFVPRIYNYASSSPLATPTESVTYYGDSLRFATEAADTRSVLTNLYFRMDDPLWAAAKIGPSEATIGDMGSLLCVLAYDAAVPTDPLQINQQLSAADAYTETGGILWQAANTALAPKQYTSYDKFAPDFAIQNLSQGKTVLLKVRTEGNNALWLWLRHASPDGYLLYDPRTASSSLLPANTRVYALVIGE